MNNKLFVGACTALVTPFDNGKIDYKSLDRLIEFQIDNGVSAIAVSGTTGESAVLSYREHQNLIKHTVRRVDRRIPVIVGTGSNDTSRAVRMTKYACEYGADGILAVTPYYNKASNDGLFMHYQKIAEVSTSPIIAYNVPSRTGFCITAEQYAMLSKIDKLCYVKEASTSIRDIAYSMSLCDGLDFICGNDDMLLPMLSIGAVGIISVLSNIFPAATVKICKLYSSGSIKEATALYKRFLKLSRLLFCEVNPIPTKHLLARMGFCKNELRLPLCSLSPQYAAPLEKEFDRLVFEMAADLI